MALDFVVNSVKKTKLKRVQEASMGAKYENPHKGKIIGDDYTPPKKSDSSGGSASGDSASGGPFQELSWDKCRHRVAHGEKSLCRKYVSGCAQEKCPKKNIDV